MTRFTFSVMQVVQNQVKSLLESYLTLFLKIVYKSPIEFRTCMISTDDIQVLKVY